MALIVKSINDGMGGVTDWKVGRVEGTGNVVIDYEGKYCPDALKELAGKVPGAERWVEGQTVNLCRCETLPRQGRRCEVLHPPVPDRQFPEHRSGKIRP